VVEGGFVLAGLEAFLNAPPMMPIYPYWALA
jgi:hypothetical protein